MASSRAVKMLGNYGILSTDELEPVKKVLGAAALTYVAAAIDIRIGFCVLFLFLAEETTDKGEVF